jgi:hypothetical protein
MSDKQNTEHTTHVRKALEEQERRWIAGETIAVGDIARATGIDYSDAWSAFQRFIVEQNNTTK